MGKNVERDTMIVADEKYFSLDSYKTKLNNNTLIVGASGTGKTRSVVIPNLLQASGSYIICDPKGVLYEKYGEYMKKQGYVVKYLDFIHPEKSDHYNPFDYIHTTQDVVKVADMLTMGDRENRADPFWDDAASLLVASVIALLKFHCSPKERNFDTLNHLLSNSRMSEYSSGNQITLDFLFERVESNHPDSWAVRQYQKARVAAEKTWNSILITLTAKLRNFDTEELTKMMAYDTIQISSIGKRKTALFVVVSDSDRSMDVLVNLFFSQAMNQLCMDADESYPDYRLPVPVRFILDDFATNCKIDQFPRMISAIRSRGISVMLMIQAESQLEQGYGKDRNTIISNCDTYCYLGGTDLETAQNIAERVDEPLKKVLYMPVGYTWVFRRGSQPEFRKLFDLQSFSRYQEAEAMGKQYRKQTIHLQPDRTERQEI